MTQLETLPASVYFGGRSRSIESRRLALKVLKRRNAPLALADLAEDVVRERHGQSTGDADHEAIEECQTRLYHTHVPKLADAGLVDYDPGTRTVRYAGNAAVDDTNATSLTEEVR